MHSYLSYSQFKVWLHHFIVNWKAPIANAPPPNSGISWMDFMYGTVPHIESSTLLIQVWHRLKIAPCWPRRPLSLSAVPPFHTHARRGKNIAATFWSVIFEKWLPAWHRGAPTSHGALSPWPCVLFICGRSSPFIGRSGFPVSGSQRLVSGALTDTGGQRKVSARHRPRHCPGARAVALKAYRLPTEVLFHAFDLV